jgi:hypothetical protein
MEPERSLFYSKEVDSFPYLSIRRPTIVILLDRFQYFSFFITKFNQSINSVCQGHVEKAVGLRMFKETFLFCHNSEGHTL